MDIDPQYVKNVLSNPSFMSKATETSHIKIRVILRNVEYFQKQELKSCCYNSQGHNTHKKQ